MKTTIVLPNTFANCRTALTWRECSKTLAKAAMWTVRAWGRFLSRPCVSTCPVAHIRQPAHFAPQKTSNLPRFSLLLTCSDAQFAVGSPSADTPTRSASAGPPPLWHFGTRAPSACEKAHRPVLPFQSASKARTFCKFLLFGAGLRTPPDAPHSLTSPFTWSPRRLPFSQNSPSFCLLLTCSHGLRAAWAMTL
jgi:hypothetical protein